MTDTDRADVTSLMTQVTTLANDKRLLEERLKENATIVERFKEQEREEMKKKFDTVIQQWIDENDWTDPKLKESVLNGMKDMVEHNKRDNPIWNMVCCASSTHKNNVNTLQKVQEQYNELKGRVESGSFRGEDSRLQAAGSFGGGGGGAGSKRKEPECGSSVAGGASLWDSFGDGFSKEVSSFIPDPDVIRSLRTEWKQGQV
jgi:hypothetical protein